MADSDTELISKDNNSRPDPWQGLRQYTAARIALGRTGGSQRMETVLDFRLSHARAKDAVMAEFQPEKIAETLSTAGLESLLLHTAVSDKKTYLARPDQGRSLDHTSRELLEKKAREWGSRDLVIILSDGLAAQAVEKHSVETVTLLAEALCAAGWSLFPIIIAPFGRVKLQDEIGELLGAPYSLMFLGERPGLGTPDSLGAYLTCNPSAQCSDADRNCVSNIRPEGLPPSLAAKKLDYLLTQSRKLGVSGVRLKDTQSAADLEIDSADR